MRKFYIILPDSLGKQIGIPPVTSNFIATSSFISTSIPHCLLDSFIMQMTPFIVSIHSWFYLSIGLALIGNATIQLQYIPCSYLSAQTFCGTGSCTLFQYIPCSYLSWLEPSCICISFVSIHPMFLFIIFSTRKTTRLFSFQYIPCSYLSGHEIGFFCKDLVSIHPMFLFISAKGTLDRFPWCFNTSHVPIYRRLQKIS